MLALMAVWANTNIVVVIVVTSPRVRAILCGILNTHYVIDLPVCESVCDAYLCGWTYAPLAAATAGAGACTCNYARMSERQKTKRQTVLM